ncbi:uncharacterized protein EMH_0097240 [Eimeria mitis]|uniref:SAG family member n=1 Tax=Eimeria mitis TaxID=44415 RepID=U6KGN6_9EIME|nr:uncharacterized protein EMH_0097240 [Eimeria mitis]CDJ35402.1 hypothetical protein EMH_0097240 [Eimeria mitis]
MSVNLARNGKLPVHISEVARDEGLVTALKAQVVEDGALTGGTNKEYPKDEAAWGKIWAEEEGSSLAYLLGSTSTTIGEEYFNGLIARTTFLKDMTAEDLKTSVEAGGAAAAAVPTVLIAGLLAMLTTISA